jgi:hypothetical protein
MLVVMDMSTGKIEERAEPEFGSFEDEVLNAEWQRPELQLGLQPVVVATAHHDPAPAEAEVESFLKNVYLSQE